MTSRTNPERDVDPNRFAARLRPFPFPPSDPR
jgi:hypothetical protein